MSYMKLFKNSIGWTTALGTEQFVQTLSGKVVDFSSVGIDNATVVIIDQAGQFVGKNNTNASGSWFITTTIPIVNLTVIGYNPNNKSQGGNAYPFIN
jgi:hypothetical protein